jgi:hypothetical protein
LDEPSRENLVAVDPGLLTLKENRDALLTAVDGISHGSGYAVELLEDGEKVSLAGVNVAHAPILPHSPSKSQQQSKVF